MKKYSLCITTFNRYKCLIESFMKVIDDPRVDEIIIVDDCSEWQYWEMLNTAFGKENQHPKVRIYRNESNIGMMLNKQKAISYAKNDWVCLWDSDNIFDASYLDAMDYMLMDEKIIYAPSYAAPAFDYRHFSGKTFDKDNIEELLNENLGECLINTANFIINKNNLPFEDNKEVKGNDTSWWLYVLLKNGYSIHVVKDMFYTHVRSHDSEWMKHATYNLAQATSIKNLMLNLQ